MTLAIRISSLEKRIRRDLPLNVLIDRKADDISSHSRAIDRARAASRRVFLITQGEGVFQLLPDGSMTKEV